MIIVKCSGEYAFGGRTEDTFVIEGHSTLDELQSYIENKQPIKCQEPTTYSKWNIINEESLRDRLVYLNNYLKIKESHQYIMNDEELRSLKESVCNNCCYNGDSISSIMQCRYNSDGSGGCKNYKEYFSLRKWIKSKFN